MGDDGDVPGGLCQERHEAVGRPVPAMLKALPSRRHVGERILSPQLIQNRISGADVLETHALPFSHAQLLQVIHVSARRPYPKPWQKAITKTTKEPRTKQAIPPTETAAQYKERSPPWPFDLNYQRGLLSLFSLCSEVRITPHHENGLLHLHLVWCSILSSETAETLAAARVSWVTPFSATLVVRWLQFGYFPF